MISHVVTLICVLLILWIVFRWGGFICMAYAAWYFCTGQWFFAGICFAFAVMLETVKTGVMLVERDRGYRGPWI